ncbi:hypothetical protein GUITHDRAFT_64501 [Guillardia theta CCMP2712]|uniref:UV excision repair protein RAD23 n=1 Tax=Guillardia theta (strain CCMP2712) TaxID=905079 RepID=L1JYI8_GUITC|nr:hypothetical protein GUITHDRAFT_64501 [Guillardia theta CCMP2712]EKX53158.1 hypothetical protein GUITHDRAFT_64501 [Guillardia theta CCMP2712]|eukprot:XP_005840138.1 hypothetical protein GUITHDRAFT_64501 [Guillardia theta CCMP2712]
MKVKVKSIAGDNFEVEIGGSSTVFDLKKAISEVKRYDVTDEMLRDSSKGMKIILQGKILDDSQTISSLGPKISFFVMMPPEGVTLKKVEVSKPQDQPAVTSGLQNNTILMGEDLEASVREICGMGFAESEVRRALRLAFNNPDRAVEILYNGASDDAQQMQNEQPAEQQQQQQGASPEAPSHGSMPLRFNMDALAVNASEAGAGGNQLEMLRRDPQFAFVRHCVQSQPSLLPELLLQIGRVNPSLLATINQNQAEFVRIVNEPGMQNPQEPSQHTIQLTREELDQVERLEQLVVPMGLDRQAVLEAWLACDKDEQLAANYLLNNLEDILASRGGFCSCSSSPLICL